MKNNVLWRLVVVPVVLVFGLAGYWMSGNHVTRSPTDPTSQRNPASLSLVRDSPVRLRPRKRWADSIRTASQTSQIPSWLCQPDIVPVLPADIQLTPSLCLHLIKLRGFDTELYIEFQKNRTKLTLWKTLLDQSKSKKYFGYASIIRTRDGIRFPTLSQFQIRTAGDESHRDLCLATLGEWGIPLSFQINVDEQSYILGDVLRDSVANFQLDKATTVL